MSVGALQRREEATPDQQAGPRRDATPARRVGGGTPAYLKPPSKPVSPPDPPKDKQAPIKKDGAASDAGKDKKDDDKKAQAAARARAAGGAADEQRKQGEKPPARGGGGKGGAEKEEREGGKVAELVFTHQPLEPVTGTASLDREALRILVDIPAFAAPLTLPFAPKRDEKAGGGGAAPVGDYRALFADAAAASLALYRDLGDAARRIAGEAEALAGDLASRHAASLNASLVRLDDDLANARGRLAVGRDATLRRLHDGAGVARSKVWAATESSLGQLDSLYHKYLGAMGKPWQTRAAVEKTSHSAASRLGKAKDGALASLNKLKTDPKPLHGDSGPWKDPIDEAVDAKLPQKVDFEVKALTQQFDGALKPLQAFDACLPCKMNQAFADLQGRVTRVHVAGPQAVRAARDAGLTSIANTEVQVEDLVQRSVANTDDNLVRQHDMARARHAEGARASLAGERARLEAATRMQVRTLAAQAEAQPRSLQGVVDRLGEAKTRTESQFAPMVASSAERLRAGTSGTAARQPGTAKLAVSLARASVEQQAERAGAATERAVAEGGRGGEEMVSTATASNDAEVDKGIVGLEPVPASVTDATEAYLDPTGTSYLGAAKSLGDHVNGLKTELDGILAGGGGKGGGEAKEGEEAGETEGGGQGDKGKAAGPKGAQAGKRPPDKEKLAASPSSPKAAATPASKRPPGKAGEGGGAADAKAGGCGDCAGDKGKGKDAGKGGADAAPAGKGDAAGKGGGADGKGAAAPAKAPAPGGGDKAPAGKKADAKAPTSAADKPRSVEELITLGEDIAKDPLAHEPLKAWRESSHKAVIANLEPRAKGIDTELSSFIVSCEKVVTATHGLTARQGNAFRHYDTMRGSYGSLDERIDDRLWYHSTSWRSTKYASIDAAIANLNGRNGEAAFKELIASFVGSDQIQRAEQALLALSPAELANMRKAHKSELQKMAADLDGADRKRFEALVGLGEYDPGDDSKFDPTQSAANYNALKLQEDIAKGRATEGEKGWNETGDKIATASKSAGASRLSGNDDPFGLDTPDVAKAQSQREWEKTQIAYGKLEGAVKGAKSDSVRIVNQKGREETDAERKDETADRKSAKFVDDEQLKAAQKALVDKATKTIEHHHVVYVDGVAMEWDTTDKVGDDHKLWIQRIVETGADSTATKAARLAIEVNKTGKPDRDRLDSSMHFGSADAVEGGHYDEKARAKGLAAAKEDQDKVLKLYARDEAVRAGKDPDSAEQDPEKIRAGIQGKLAAKFGDDKKGAADALAITAAPGKDNAGKGALAAMELAISKENKDIAIKQLQRMDAKEIEKLKEDYRAAHPPPQKGLEEQLGINGNHWTWDNWNGATFSGDDANAIEVAFMGVPQNPKERGEVALRIMQQQIDQAGWMGKLLANDEWKTLNRNAQALRDLMGAGEGQIDSRGRIIAKTDPQTGKPLAYGHFTENGELDATHAGDGDAFERMVALSRVSADNYTQSVEKIATFITTSLVVVAAIVTTVLTGGAAASIWIPVLVTAAAGVVGMGVNMAMKGGRYGRDEMVRDIVSTIVQAATAGIGAAAGAGLRGGSAAVKGLAGSLRMSEAKLAEMAGKTVALRALSLGEEVAIGAGTSALASGATTALDPATRRGDNYWSDVLHAIGRGAAGGALGAVGARLGSKGFELAAQKLGGGVSRAAMAAARAAGKSEAEVVKAGEKALAEHIVVEVGTRAFASGTSGALSRGGEMLYDKEVRGQETDWGEILHEMGAAAFQNFVQGLGEGVADRGMRAMSASRREEHEWVQAHPHDPHAPPLTRDGDPGAEEATALAARSRKSSAPQEEARAAPAEAGTPPPHGEEPRAAQKPEAKRAPAASPEPEEAVPHAIAKGSGAVEKLIEAANDNGPTQRRIALSATNMIELGPIAEGTVFVHPNSTSREAANDNFGRMVLADPKREVAVYRNPITGEHIVIQGGATVVGAINAEGKLIGKGSDGRAYAWQSVLDSKGGHWVLEHHYHPNQPGEFGTHISRRLPSGAGADFSVVIREVTDLGHESRSSRIYFIDEGKLSFTDFGVDTKNPKKPFWISFPDPETGVRARHEFASLEEYHGFVGTKIGEPYPLPKGFVEPTLATIKVGEASRALAAGSTHKTLGAEDIAAVHSVVAAAAHGPPEEAHAAIRALGLVAEPDSMARLHLIVNEPSIPVDTRKQLAAMVLEANRAHLVSVGLLAPDEPLHVMFHGAPAERSASIRKDGIDLSRVKGGSADDFGRGLYFGRELETGIVYAARDGGKGEIFPFLLRESELGHLVDVRTGGRHRGAWDAFLDREPAAYPPFTGGLAKTAREWITGNANFRQKEPVRGEVFEAFLKEQQLTSAAVIHGDLGKDALTAGIGQGEQFSIRSQRVAELMNEQMGFRRAGGTPAIEEAVPHAIAGGKKQGGATGGAPQIQPAHEDAVLAELAKMRRGPAAVKAIKEMIALDRPAAMAVLHADDAKAPAALAAFRDALVKQGMPLEKATLRMKRLDLARATLGSRFRIETEFAAGLTKISTKGLSEKLSRWVQESAALQWLHSRDPALFLKFHEDFVALDSQAGGRNRARFFTSYVVARLSRTHHPLFEHLGILKLDDAVVRMAVRTHQLQSQTDPVAPAAPGKLRPNSHSGPKVTDPATVEPGMRVDHPTAGRGTVKAVSKDGVARIRLDPPNPRTIRVDIETGQLRAAREPDARFDKEPPVHRNKSEQQAEFAEIANYRKEAAYPKFVRNDSETGTVARLSLRGETFYGTNSTLDPGVYSLPKGTRRELLEQIRKSAGLKAKNLAQAQFVSHAEAEALIQAYRRFGALPEVVELFVDRQTCPSCSRELIRLARMLGIKELRIYYPGQSNPPLVRN
ncbi:MAG: hypothetical protein JO013_10105 [Alphaproteobacteria bacterium]|nr:hypothetical protein [Alphaproteobacteria bacterium]